MGRLHEARIFHQLLSDIGDVVYMLMDDNLYTKEEAAESLLRIMYEVEAHTPTLPKSNKPLP